MVEVFKTNVKNQRHADMVLDQIHKNFEGYNANFDLEDCDNILRVVCDEGLVLTPSLIELLLKLGFTAEVLADDPQLVQEGL